MTAASSPTATPLVEGHGGFRRGRASTRSKVLPVLKDATRATIFEPPSALADLRVR